MSSRRTTDTIIAAALLEARRIASIAKSSASRLPGSRVNDESLRYWREALTASENANERTGPAILPGCAHLNQLGVYEHPLVEPQVSHLRQVPLRTIV